MAKTCDNKSVGILIEKDGKYAMIFRKNYPRAWAMIAGHVDDHGTERDAIRVEVAQEGELNLERSAIVFRQDIDNPCKRDGGTHHEWTVFEAYDWSGIFHASTDAKKAEWKTIAELKTLAYRTEYFIKKFNIPYTEVGLLTRAICGTHQGPNEDQEWTKNPGLEAVWYYILKNLSKI